MVNLIILKELLILLVRHASDDMLYLYDMVNTKLFATSRICYNNV